MLLLDFPPEIFQRIVHEFVSDVGIDRAWKYRKVCRTFASEIYHDIFTNQPISMFKSANCRILKSNLKLYLLNRTWKPLDVNEFLPKKINDMVDFLLHGSSSHGPDQHRRYAKILCGKVVSECRDIYELLCDGPDSPRIFNSTCEELKEDKEYEGKTAAAASVGDHRLLATLLPQLPSDNAGSPLFGKPLKNSVIQGNPEIVTTVLRRVGRSVMEVTEALNLSIQRENFDLMKMLGDWYQTNLPVPRATEIRKLLRISINTGDARFINYMMQFKVKGRPRLDRALFEHACELGHAGIVALFLGGKGLIEPDKPYRNRSCSYFVEPSPLISAIKSGHSDVLWVVIKAGAHVDGAQRDNCYSPNPLITAIQASNEAAVKMLLKRGASLEISRSGNKIYPLETALQEQSESIYKIIRRAKIKREGGEIPAFHPALKTLKRG